MTSGNRTLRLLLVNGFSMPKSRLDPLLNLETDLYMPSFSVPLAILALAANVRQAFPGWEIRVWDANKELHAFFAQAKKDCHTIRSFVRDGLTRLGFTPDVVGFSVNYSTGHSSSFELAEAVKELWPDAVTVFGGVHVTNYTRGVIANPSVDYAIRGAAELSFCRFLSAIAERRSPDDIPGVVGKSSRLDTVSPPLHDLDQLPLPAYDLVDAEYYIRHDTRSIMRQENTRSLPYQFSRGCCFNCTFCAGLTVHGHQVIRKNTDKVISELLYLKDTFHINTIIVEDDLFGFNKPWFYELCGKIKAGDLQLKFTFPSALSVAVLDEPMIDQLIEIGMESAILAIESGSDHVQKKLIKKRCDLPKALRLSAYLRSKGIPVMAYFILGFPDETVGMMRETIAFAKQMNLDWAYFLIACPLYGAEMCRQLFDRGILDEDKMIAIMDNTDFSRRLYETPEISATDLEQLAYDANIEVNFFRNYNMLHGNYDQAIRRFTTVIAHFPFHVVALACRANCLLAKGEQEAAQRDVETCNRLIENHPESRRLAHRYREELLALRLPLPLQVQTL